MSLPPNLPIGKMHILHVVLNAPKTGVLEKTYPRATGDAKTYFIVRKTDENGKVHTLESNDQFQTAKQVRFRPCSPS